MTLIFAGADLSGYPTKYGFVETPRRIAGPNEGVAINGKGIDDTVAVKMDPSYTLKPLTPEQVSVLWGLAIMTGYQSLTYSDSKGSIISTRARLLVNAGAALALINSDHIFYNGITITFEIE